jgi:hypothetical protein
MSIVVHWIESRAPGSGSWKPDAEFFEDAEFMLAMKRMEELRKEGMTHVSMSTELADSVGKPGVDSVKDGKTPDGVEYDWKKRRI